MFYSPGGRWRIVSPLFLLLFTIVAVCDRSKAGTITVSFTEMNGPGPGESFFSLDVMHPNALQTHNQLPISRGATWRVFVNPIQEVHPATKASDTLKISGEAQHMVGPHGEGMGPLFEFMFDIAASGMSPGNKRAASPPFLKGHGSHSDQFSAILNYGIADATRGGSNVQDITFYNLRVEGVHTPEPATIVLLGLAVLGFLVRRLPIHVRNLHRGSIRE